MTDVEFDEFDSAQKMTEFFARNNNLLKDNAKAVSLNTALLADIAVLETSAANRISAAGLRTDATADKLNAREDLYKYLRKIADTAKTIKTENPDFDNTFKIPKGTLSNQEVLDTAQSFYNDMDTANSAIFNSFGINGAIATILQTKITAFEAAQTQQNSGKGSGVAATATEKSAIKKLKKNRRAQKNVVLNLLEDNGDAGLVAEWKSATKIEKRGTPPTPPTPPNNGEGDNG